jgi:hypothetical protein
MQLSLENISVSSMGGIGINDIRIYLIDMRRGEFKNAKFAGECIFKFAQTPCI